MASYCFRPHQTWTQPVAASRAALSLGLRLWLEEGEGAWSWLWGWGSGRELELRHSSEGGQSWGFLQEPPNRSSLAFFSSWQRCGSKQEELQEESFASRPDSLLKIGESYPFCARLHVLMEVGPCVYVFQNSVSSKHPVQINIWCTWGSYTKFLFTWVLISTSECINPTC